MRARRVDANQTPIVDALRAIGCTVQSLAMVGQGVPDLLVGINGRNFLMEVKNEDQPPSKQSLTTDELLWHNEWKGKVAIVRNVKEALAAIGAQLQ
jgi:hypothetical protein